MPDESTAREAAREVIRLQAALRTFPLPSQFDGAAENYRRILDWLYGPAGTAPLIVDLGMKEQSSAG